MNRRWHGWMLALVALSMPGLAAATNSPIELKTALKSLMAWLPGEFDSEPQRFFETEYKTPADLVHRRVFRAYTRIQAPQLGENLLVAQVRDGGKDGRFDEMEFQLWTLSVDSTRRVVRMWPRRFKDPARFRDHAGDPAAFNGLSDADLLPAQGAAGCEILWRLNVHQLRGTTVPGACSGAVAAGRPSLQWEWEYLLDAEELWINFAGRDSTGRIAFGRADQTHWRLGKARDFECFLVYRPGQGEEQGDKRFHLNDRGEVRRFELKDGRGSRPVFMTLIRGMWPSNSGRNYLDLLRLQVYEGRPEEAPGTWKSIGNSIGSAATDRVGFATPTLTGRCKLAREAVPAPEPSHVEK